MCCLTIVRENVPLLNDHFRDSRLQYSVALCYVDRFGSNHLLSSPTGFSLSPLQGNPIGQWVRLHHRMEVVPSYLGPYKGKSIV